MNKFNQMADEILIEDIQLDEAVLGNIKKFVKNISDKLEDKIVTALKKSGAQTEEEALEVMKNIFKDMEKEDLY